MAGLLKYDPSVYTPRGLKQNLTTAEAKAEYQRLRSVALKRLNRFRGTKYTETQIYRQYGKPGYFKPLSKIESERELYYELSELTRFLRKKRSSVSGNREIERNIVKTLRERNYEGISISNLDKFVRFMELAKANSIARYYDSVRAAEVFGENRNKGIDEMLKEFQKWEEEEYEY